MTFFHTILNKIKHIVKIMNTKVNENILITSYPPQTLWLSRLRKGGWQGA